MLGNIVQNFSDFDVLEIWRGFSVIHSLSLFRDGHGRGVGEVHGCEPKFPGDAGVCPTDADADAGSLK